MEKSRNLCLFSFSPLSLKKRRKKEERLFFLLQFSCSEKGKKKREVFFFFKNLYMNKGQMKKEKSRSPPWIKNR